MRMERSSQQQCQESNVVAIDCVTGSSRASEWGGDTVQSGDVVEEIKIGSSPAVRSPFKGGRSGIHKMLHAAFKRGDTSIGLRVRRSAGSGLRDEMVEMRACIVPGESSSGRKHYILRSIHDPNYAVGLVDRMESECIAIQGSRSARVASALSKAQIQDGYVAYPWQKKMKESLPILNSSSFLSLLILPKGSDPDANSYNALEDTLARANSWLISSQTSGVPIVFLNVQTEGLLTKISGEKASSPVYTGSVSDLSNLANVSLYGFEDYHGVDIGVVRAVRLWYTPFAGELAIEIKLQEGDTKLGFAISRTQEGFIYVSSVIENDEDCGVASTRSGLRDLYKEAERASKLLVISRVSNEKVLPWMVSTAGAIRCFDTVSLSHKLSLHRHALRPILIHVLMWEKSSSSTPFSSGIEWLNNDTLRASPPTKMPERAAFVGASGPAIGRDTAGDISFRFHDFSVANNWV